MRISNGPHNRALSHPEVGEPEHSTDLFALRHEGGIPYNPTCKTKCYKTASRRGGIRTSNSMYSRMRNHGICSQGITALVGGLMSTPLLRSRQRPPGLQLSKCASPVFLDR
jgi:hypothetical protein